MLKTVLFFLIIDLAMLVAYVGLWIYNLLHKMALKVKKHA